MSKNSRKRRRELQRQARESPEVFDAELNPNQEPVGEVTRSAPPSVTRRLMMEFQHFAGPIPPPAILGEYEQVCEGSANRILAQFEEQGRHRRSLENKAVNYNVASAVLGQVFGLILFLTALGVGGFLIYNDKPVGGIVSIITAVGGSAWVLLKAELAKRKNLSEKRTDQKKK